MPGVEAESDERRIGAPQELFRLGRRFDVRPGVWMEGGHEAHLLRAARDLVRTLGEALPLVIGEMRIARAYATGDALAFRNTGLREHEHRRTEIGEKPAGIHRIGHLLVVAKRVVQRHRTERAGEREAACTQLLPKYGGILREVSPGPKLGAHVAQVRHLVEDPLVRQHHPPVRKLADAPADGRRPELHPRRVPRHRS